MTAHAATSTTTVHPSLSSTSRTPVTAGSSLVAGDGSARPPALPGQGDGPTPPRDPAPDERQPRRSDEDHDEHPDRARVQQRGGEPEVPDVAQHDRELDHDEEVPGDRLRPG